MQQRWLEGGGAAEEDGESTGQGVQGIREQAEQSCEGEGEGGAGRRGVEVMTKPELGEKSFQSRELELRDGDCRLQAPEIMLSPLQNLKLLGSIASAESCFQVGLCDLHSV